MRTGSSTNIRLRNHGPTTDTKSNHNPNPNPTPKQHAIVTVQLNTVSCPTYPEKFTRDDVVAPCFTNFALSLSHRQLSYVAVYIYHISYYDVCFGTLIIRHCAAFRSRFVDFCRRSAVTPKMMNKFPVFICPRF